MILQSTWEWLEQTRLATAIAEGAYYFPSLEAAHVVGLALVLGSIGTFDLAVLGVGPRARNLASLLPEILPWTWAGFFLALTTGALMFASSATTYVTNRYFLVKMGLLLLVGVNALVFHRIVERHPRLELGGAVRAHRVSAGISLTLWLVIVALGRWIGFL